MNINVTVDTATHPTPSSPPGPDTAHLWPPILIPGVGAAHLEARSEWELRGSGRAAHSTEVHDE